jgi:hypothetical protein
MVIDLTNNSNVDAALLNFDAGNVMTTVKKDLGMFDKKRPLADAKEELKNLMDSRDVVSAKVIDAIKSNDKKALADALKKQRLLNKMIYIVQSEVDYKTQVEFMKANSVAKAPVEVITKEVIEKAKETADEIESDVKDKEELTNLITDIKASTGDVVAKAKVTAKGLLSNPQEYFTTKNVLIVTASAFAIYGLVKFIK